MEEILKGPKKTAAGPFHGRDQPFQCFKCHGWGHLARECPSLENYWWGEKNLLPQEQTDRTTGESNRDNDSTTPTAKSNTKSQSEQNPVDAWATSDESKNWYYNPDLLARHIGKSNESTIIIDGEQHMALIDSGAQVTTITVDLVNKLKLPVYGLQTLLNF